MPRPEGIAASYTDRVTRFCAFAASLAIAMSLGAAPAVAGGSDPKADAARIFHEVMSPFCPGLTLADCPSQQAFALRDEISVRLAWGVSPGTVRAELVQRYGVAILADPTPTPIGAVLWGTPVALALLAAIGLAFFVRRSVGRAQIDRDCKRVDSPGLVRLLDDLLHALD
jgi:cytochrome c-type biogenesis protein CcmH/NrfF